MVLIGSGMHSERRRQMNSIDLDKLLSFSRLLMEGIDPTTNQAFAEDTILNMPELKKYNAEVNHLISTLINSHNSEKRKRDNVEKHISLLDFYIDNDKKESFVFSKEPISISMICNKLNECRGSNSRKLYATEITSALCRLGYLEEDLLSDSKKKVPTSRGSELGIIRVQNKNEFGNSYSVNLYNTTAQRFVYDNIMYLIK